MLISVLTSSLICLSKVQFHMCSFPRSNCQFLEHRHFTTQEREENNCRFLTLQFTPSWQGQERSCLQMYDFHGRPHFLQRLVYTLSECNISIAFLVAPPVSWSVCFQNSCGEPSFFFVYLYPSAPPECTTAFVRMFFSCKIPFWILLHFVPSLVKVAC